MQNLRFVVLLLAIIGSSLTSCTNNEASKDSQAATATNISNKTERNSVMVQKTVTVNGERVVAWSDFKAPKKSAEILDSKGNLSVLSYDNGVKVTFSYDEMNQLVERVIVGTDNQKHTTKFEYPKQDLVKVINDGNGHALYNIVDGNIIKKTYFDEQGSLTDETMYNYNEKSNFLVAKPEKMPYHSVNSISQKIFLDYFPNNKIQSIKSSFNYEENNIDENVRVSENKDKNLKNQNGL